MRRPGQALRGDFVAAGRDVEVAVLQVDHSLASTHLQARRVVDFEGQGTASCDIDFEAGEAQSPFIEAKVLAEAIQWQ